MTELLNCLRRESLVEDVLLLQKIISDVTQTNRDGLLELLPKYLSKRLPINDINSERNSKLKSFKVNANPSKSPRKAGLDFLQESDSENNDLKRVSTAPRRPGSRHPTRFSKKENNPFLKDFVQSQMDTQMSSIDDMKRLENSPIGNSCLTMESKPVANAAQGQYMTCSASLGSGGESSEHTPCSGSSSIINQNSTPFTQESPKNLNPLSSTNHQITHIHKSSFNTNNHRLNVVNNQFDVKKPSTNIPQLKSDDKFQNNARPSTLKSTVQSSHNDEMDISDNEQISNIKPKKSENITIYNQEVGSPINVANPKKRSFESSFSSSKHCQIKPSSRPESKEGFSKETLPIYEFKNRLKIQKNSRKSQGIEFYQASQNQLKPIDSNQMLSNSNRTSFTSKPASALNLSSDHKNSRKLSDLNMCNSPSISIGEESLQKVHWGHPADKIFGSNQKSCVLPSSDSNYTVTNQLFSETMTEQYQAEIAEINQLYPKIHKKSLAKDYRLEFELLYPDYLSAHNISNGRWEKIRAIYNQIQSYKDSNNSENKSKIIEISHNLQDLIDDALSPQLQSQEMKLSLMAFKLRLLKSHLYAYYSTIKQSNNP